MTWSYLGLGPVLVKAGETGEVLWWNRRRILLADEGICVGRIANNNHLSDRVSKASH